jgi:hypothetical protein
MIRAVLHFRNHLRLRFSYYSKCRASFNIGANTMILADNLPILRCPSCGGVMKLVRSVPRLGTLPDLLVVACSSCEEVQVKEGEDQRAA